MKMGTPHKGNIDSQIPPHPTQPPPSKIWILRVVSSQIGREENVAFHYFLSAVQRLWHGSRALGMDYSLYKIRMWFFLKKKILHNETNIIVEPFENLLIDKASEVGAQIVIRGLRAVSDFEYEFQLVGMNRAMNDSIETTFLMAEAKHQAIASRLVKEIARLGGDVSKFVTPGVETALKEKFKHKA